MAVLSLKYIAAPGEENTNTIPVVNPIASYLFSRFPAVQVLGYTSYPVPEINH